MNFKQSLFSQFARIGKALSNANRLELLEFLAQAERSVEDLARVSGLTVANTSQHLQQLRQSGLVNARKDGLKVYYSISDNDVILMLGSLRAVAERHLSQVEQLVNTFLAVKDSFEPVPRDELMARIEQGLVIVLDVRPALEYQAGHLPGAINVPVEELDQRMKEFEDDPAKEFVAYCRGPHCILAFDAVEKLREQGYKASRMEDGFPEWKLAGLPVEENE